VEKFVQDLHYALRTLARQPAFTVAAVLSLALGIGASTLIFTVINAAFLAPLPIAGGDRLVAVVTTDESYPGYLPASYPNFEDFRDRNDVLSGLVVWQFLGMNMTGGERPERLFGQMVSGGYFDLLGVHAALGRTFLPEDDAAPGKNPVAVISHALWQRRFGSDPHVVGSKVRINGHELTITGVTPAGFFGTNRITACDVWIPTSMYTQISRFRASFHDRSFRMFQMMGRLRPGVSVSQADAAFRSLARNLERTYPEVDKGWGAAVVPLSHATLDVENRPKFVQGSLFLAIIVGLLLLMTCANLASLLLARSEARRPEMAIRLAVGAGRRRILRQLLTESAVLALLGGASGLLLSQWGSRAIWRMRPPFLADDTPLVLGVDARVLAFTLLVSLLTGVLFGLLPAWRSTRPDLSPTLRAAAQAGGRGRRLGVLAPLSVAQLALAVVALIGAGLFLRSLTNAERIDPGFAAERLAVLSFDLAAQGYDEVHGRDLDRRVLARAASVPGVQSATLSSHRPLNRVGVLVALRVEGLDPAQRVPPVRTEAVGRDYFKTVGIPLLKGRDFSAIDRDGAPRVAIVNETLARRYWPGMEPIGKRFTVGDDKGFIQVVGLARDAKYVDMGEAPQPYFYQPLEQAYAPLVTLWARTAHPEGLAETLRREVQSLAPDLPLTDVGTAGARVQQSLWAARLGASLLAGFGSLALLLAAVGVYGVTSYSVSQRRREIGIRLALGATRGQLLGLIVGQTCAILAAGMTLGLALALSGRRLVANMLYGIDAANLATYVAVCCFLAAVALLSSFLPARRATRVDALRVLRAD
jgi:predicted permease